MDVAELIEELEKLPRNATVEISAQTRWDVEVKFLPEMIEGLVDGNGDAFAVIWAFPASPPIKGETK